LRRLLLVAACSAGCRAAPPVKKGQPPATAEDDTGVASPGGWRVAGALHASPVRAVTRLGDTAFAVTAGGLFTSTDEGATWALSPMTGLPSGDPHWIGSDGHDALFMGVLGYPVYRSTDGAETWAPTSRPPLQPLFLSLNPHAHAAPTGVATGEDGTVWLTSVGGLHHSADGGDTWTLADTPSSGDGNVVFTDVSVQGDAIVAVGPRATSTWAPALAALSTGTVFASADAGGTWTSVGGGLPALLPTSVVHIGEDLCVGTLDAGTWCSDDDSASWTALGGPTDTVALTARTDGTLGVGSATRGAWTTDRAGGWSQSGEGAIAGFVGDLALTTSGVSLQSDATPSPPPTPAGGTVYLALALRVQYAHASRPDAPTEAGYGRDIGQLAEALDALDAHPSFAADWDIDHATTLDDWMPSDSPELLARIQARVATGTDDVRITSWSDGLMASHTHAEFDEAVARAQASADATFGRHVPGVHPTRDVVSPEHLGWYADHGVEWITLSAGASGARGLTKYAAQSASSLHNPVTLANEDGASLAWAPAYGPMDVLDHGGLAAWAQQLSDSGAQDQLLLVQFEPDDGSWDALGDELDALEDLVEGGTVVPTTIHAYLQDHDPVDSLVLTDDIAAGTGGGLRAWAEKDINHRYSAELARVRARAAAAALQGSGLEEVEDALTLALPARLLAMSASHFGPATPTLHPDREAAAWERLTEARAATDVAWAAAEEAHLPAPGTVTLVNARSSAGPALIDVTVQIPDLAWTQESDVVFRDADGASIPWVLRERNDWGNRVQLFMSLVVTVEPDALTHLTWRVEPGTPPASGGLSVSDAPTVDRLQAPFTACSGTEAVGVAVETHDATVDTNGVLAEQGTLWSVPVCDAASDISVHAAQYAGLAGTVVTVSGELARPSDASQAESIALSPLACDGRASALSWRTHGGAWSTRELEAGRGAHNGQAADGTVILHCDDERDLQVAHRVGLRSSVGFAPVRDRDSRTTLAPLGTLWGPGTWHDGRHGGGAGLADALWPVFSDPDQPAAADWAGQAILYQLLVGEDIDRDALDLFAWPPVVRVGAYTEQE
jgi:hypothetical protein